MPGLFQDLVTNKKRQLRWTPSSILSHLLWEASTQNDKPSGYNISATRVDFSRLYAAEVFKVETLRQLRDLIDVVDEAKEAVVVEPIWDKTKTEGKQHSTRAFQSDVTTSLSKTFSFSSYPLWPLDVSP